MKPALLDVNVLLALAWPNHQHHAAAHAWFAREGLGGWCTTGLTQLAFIRLSSNPDYTAHAVSPGAAAEFLKSLTSHPHHLFWATPPAADPTIYHNALGHPQVMEAYLVAVARSQQGRLITFDPRLKSQDRVGDVVTVLEPSVLTG